MSKMPVAVIGAGLIGKVHIDLAARHDEVSLAAIADPTDAAKQMAASFNVPWFADYRAMLDTVKPKGVVIATPNATHARIALDCIERGVAVIVEKPIAHTVEDAKRISDASREFRIPVLVGHQRRHNPIVRRAREIVASGRLGKPVSATALCTWLKPDDYFNTSWRRTEGGGPILINLIHDIDLLRHLFGDLESLQAVTSNETRGFEVEDTAAVVLKFRNGALATVSVSDTVAAPWNYDLAAGEVERFPRQDVNSHYLCGTDASLTLPRLELWEYRSGKGWHDPLTRERTAPHAGCPYTEQLRHFRAVVDGTEAPICSALDGLRTLEATTAVHVAAKSGSTVYLPGD
ncbi:Gfo/Idh/MocA family protein [Caballeronia sp. NK8]|uniref:Gfo/Idh/MocA family protein n=1 Tax=Caballeronia sp. NK8 TaxID=140098 RepID=UPI001BCFC0A3|nr:Gfo/Idh/MocA family oxidoreductase [Caballeronia sp. NK8]